MNEENNMKLWEAAVLLFTAIILSIVLMPLGLLWTTVKSIYRSVFKKKVDKTRANLTMYMFNLALSIDQTGNTVCADLLNDVLTKSPNGKRYGDPDETISGVTGSNKLNDNLSLTGRGVAWTLNKIDPNHVEKAAIAED